jgi:DNA topoisomerase-3
LPRRLFIAEKPSLAKAIAEGLGKMTGKRPSRGQTHWEVGDDCVLWLFGHVIELVEPHDYDPLWKSWRIEYLPMLPKQWRHEPTTSYTPDRKVDKEKTKAVLGQVNACKALLRQADIVVNAGDPEREGQLLVDELMIFHGWDPFNDRTMRFWSQSLTENEVIKNITNLFPNAKKKTLYLAAHARQKADWLHGLNMTRLFTILARRTGADITLSVGRVQTPTLDLVVTRDREIANFKPVKHYMPSGWFLHQNGKFKAKWVIPADHPGLDPEGYLTDKSVAEGVLTKIAGKPGVISEFETKNNSKGPPLPYKLSTLQQACSAKFGLTAEQTLQVAQSLYEKHKATSYPRTDSQYLPTSVLKEEAAAIMASMTSTPGVDRAAQNANMTIKSKVWDDSKVSDHHGIIPTTEFHAGKLADMSPIERSVFMLIAKSFVSQFYPDQTWKTMTAIVKCEGLDFRASGRIPGSEGWRVVFDGETEDDDDGKEDNQTVPPMKRGDKVTAEKGELKDSTTKPPYPFTDGTLIAAMTDIHKFVSDPEIKKRLKENAGIGTEATRAAIIENLIRTRKFLKRDGKGKVKSIISTDAGRSVIDALPREMTSPGLTAVWEGQLEKIEKGEFPEEQFMQVLHETLRKRVAASKDLKITIKGQSVAPMKGDGDPCKCGKGTMRTGIRFVGEKKEKTIVLACDSYNKDDPNTCRNIVWPDRPKADPVPPAKGHGETCKKCGKGQMITMKSAKGAIYLKCNNWKKDAPSNCDNFAFPESSGPKCEKCGKGHMRSIPIKNGANAGKTFFSCSEYPACDNKSFPDDVKGGGKGGSSSGGKPAAKGGSKPSGSSNSKTSFTPGAKANPFGKK